MHVTPEKVILGLANDVSPEILTTDISCAASAMTAFLNAKLWTFPVLT